MCPSSETGFRAKRILVYGVTGCGKSTLAQALSAKTGLPYHSVDDYAFGPNWEMTSLEFQREKIGAICAQDEWIIDSAYTSWVDLPLARVDLVIGLDYPRAFSLWRLVRRTAARVFDGKTVCNGNRETLKTAFSKQSIVVWHFKSFDRKRAHMKRWEASGDVPIIRFERASQAARWLRDIAPSGRVSPNV